MGLYDVMVFFLQVSNQLQGFGPALVLVVGSGFQLVPKVPDQLQVGVLCRPVRFFHIRLGTISSFQVFFQALFVR